MTEAPDRLAYGFAKSRGILFRGGETPAFLIKRGGDRLALLEARRAVGRTWPVEEVDGPQFERALSDIYAFSDAEAGSLGDQAEGESLSSIIDEIPPTADLLDSASDAPIIRLINGLIAEAIRTAASDIHVEPYEDRVSVRYRIDGVLSERASLAPALASPLVSRIKVMSRLDIAEKRVPQDGRLSLTLGGKGVDVRVATLPSRFGERVVLRLLDKDQARFTLDQLGMGPANLTAMKQALAQPNGIILVTGPTGAGKTTTLYAALNLLNDSSRNILTVEDPVEYALDGVGQTQVNAKVGMTFAAGLRAILRQDPDVVMVGEIRDVETAGIAVQASLTGHLVLSTVHTNSAVAAVARLRDMGIESFLLASTLSAIVAQRLVRRLCGHCRESYSASAAERSAMGITANGPVVLYRSTGCPSCKGLGYSGRVGLYEVVTVDEGLRALIHDNASEKALYDHAFRNRKHLFQDGVSAALNGETSLSEVLRVCREEGERHAGV
ncbi:type II secretion system ATPase GspE [Hyphobacterium indicum]|uniref:type II secretion system ATPase GspE n=1 Tax=Hyphobacterium indicum TaxID=2162714 RepID=UPI000D64F053|nr:type II secretion system ATPase GspE [Hyphobacterium indicum]